MWEDYATYGATKIFNRVFALVLASQLQHSHVTKGLVDGLVLQPGMVTSGMNNHAVIKNKTSSPAECTRGTLSDLGHAKCTFGSMLHNFQGRLFVPIIG
jgi:short-subunit dehydrogenase